MPLWRACYLDIVAAQHARDVRRRAYMIEVLVEAPNESAAKRAAEAALPGVIKRVVHSEEFALYSISQFSE